jgi:hypothetical protein
VAEIAQRDPGGLMCHGRLGRRDRRPAGQQRPGPAQRLGGPGMREDEKLAGLGRI